MELRNKVSFAREDTDMRFSKVRLDKENLFEVENKVDRGCNC